MNKELINFAINNGIECKVCKGKFKRLPPKKIMRNLSTPEGRKFWETSERIAQEVKNWPDSRKAGINVSATKITTVDNCTNCNSTGIDPNILRILNNYENFLKVKHDLS